MTCTSDSLQPFPCAGRLKENLNLSLGNLRKKIDDRQAKVYSYIVASVKNPEGTFVQTGSAPNFQGDVISLCTCKHHMRSFCDIDLWVGAWIAGFTGIEAGKGRNALIYLMKTKIAFESYYDLWFSDILSGASIKCKLAHTNKFGDIFQPKNKRLDQREKYDFEHYIPPVPDHVHAPKNGWHKDINYVKGKCGRKAALLVGDRQYSFLWNKPTLFHSDQLHCGQRKDDLQFLLDLLQ